MNRFLLLSYLLIACISCKRPHVVYILPLGDVDTTDVSLARQAVEGFYHYPCIVKPTVALSDDILADSKTRCEANRILSKYNSGGYTLILTEKDIAAANQKRNIGEWGMFGLGYQPGTTCVVSTFRLKRNASVEVFHNRLIKICLHELGHNFGLPHCSSGDTRCLMRDARGTVMTVDRQQVFLCAQCSQQLCDGSGLCTVK